LYWSVLSIYLNYTQINISVTDIEFSNRLFNYTLDLIYTKYILVLKKYKKAKKSYNSNAFKISKIFKNLYSIYIQHIYSWQKKAACNNKKLNTIVDSDKRVWDLYILYLYLLYI